MLARNSQEPRPQPSMCWDDRTLSKGLSPEPQWQIAVPFPFLARVPTPSFQGAQHPTPPYGCNVTLVTLFTHSSQGPAHSLGLAQAGAASSASPRTGWEGRKSFHSRGLPAWCLQSVLLPEVAVGSEPSSLCAPGPRWGCESVGALCVCVCRVTGNNNQGLCRAIVTLQILFF